jgi:regulator of protease activity HflC (stomatin/prohibitin superfamily)
MSRPDALPNIFTTLGLDYDDRVLPSITNEVLKAVVAQFDAGELITQREMVMSQQKIMFFINAKYSNDLYFHKKK